ncbi:riboflavin-binding protein-like [Centrocercus urophasianus]|uniref:riboflavin-binding protein-like n=1 Tax=Centrocercus urophasianus TaxID=9002 RepID=UPI001C6486B4|nr:riboflavin-binding protein-like [Centrocercus urophasianus]
MLRFAITLLAVITSSTCQQYGCLEGDTHKVKPSPEPNMHECTLYSESSCCYANFTEQLAHSPVIKVSNSYWNRCGQLSKSCEDFTKKIECFYRCSPHAAHWINPRYTAFAISTFSSAKLLPCTIIMSQAESRTESLSVPAQGLGSTTLLSMRALRCCSNTRLHSSALCRYEACKDDSICAHNWLTDWERDERGENHCKSKCMPYREMYANGTDMCQSMWGESFKVSKSSCLCLQMNKKDMVAIKHLLSESSEESSSISSSEEHSCQKRLLKFEALQQEEGEETR